MSKFIICNLCDDYQWVCENHPNVAWINGNECCGGAGMMCKCHPSYICNAKEYQDDLI